MAKGKVEKILSDGEYIKTIREIQNLLKKYNVEVENNNTLLAHHIKAFNEAIKELRDGRALNEKSIKELHNKFDEILNIKVNGFIGLKNVLTVLCEATASDRANTNIKKSIKEWLNTHSTIKTILKSRPVTIVFTILLTVIGLKLLGVDLVHLDITEIIKNAF